MICISVCQCVCFYKPDIHHKYLRLWNLESRCNVPYNTIYIKYRLALVGIGKKEKH